MNRLVRAPFQVLYKTKHIIYTAVIAIGNAP